MEAKREQREQVELPSERDKERVHMTNHVKGNELWKDCGVILGNSCMEGGGNVLMLTHTYICSIF